MVTACMIRSAYWMIELVHGFRYTRTPAKAVPLAKAAVIWSLIVVPTMMPPPGR
jgi:hypothetical protein